MAAPHVAAVAALVIASGVVGSRPSPRQVEDRLKSTARDLGAPGPDERYGAGLVDAGRATAPAAPA
jgi:serine protease